VYAMLLCLLYCNQCFDDQEGQNDLKSSKDMKKYHVSKAGCFENETICQLAIFCHKSLVPDKSGSEAQLTAAHQSLTFSFIRQRQASGCRKKELNKERGHCRGSDRPGEGELLQTCPLKPRGLLP
jgi:hypothetical protein